MSLLPVMPISGSGRALYQPMWSDDAAAAVMAALERVIRRAYDLGALGATDAALGFYAARGWRTWEGPLGALTPDGVVPTPGEQGGILVLEAGVPLDLRAALTCDWRDGAVW
jgi:aminoglycoside 2'-N-acetyltransferase I